MDNKSKTGRFGEFLALKYLEKLGFCIIEKNWRVGRLEIDLIASLNRELVFFEIKTRIGVLFFPEENLKFRQIKNLKKAISFYCNLKKISIEFSRLDFIFILLNKEMEVSKFFHYKDILN